MRTILRSKFKSGSCPRCGVSVIPERMETSKHNCNISVCVVCKKLEKHEDKPPVNNRYWQPTLEHIQE